VIATEQRLAVELVDAPFDALALLFELVTLVVFGDLVELS